MTAKSFPVWVPLRPDGGPAELLADVDREPSPAEWACRITWQLSCSGGRPVAVELRAPHGERLDPARWRWVRIAEVITHSREVLEGFGLLAQLAGAREAAAVLARISDDGAQQRPGALPAEHFAWVARVYGAAVDAGDAYPVRAVRAAALRAGWGDRATDAAVRGWVRQAKRRNLITQTARPSRATNKRKGADQ